METKYAVNLDKENNSDAYLKEAIEAVKSLTLEERAELLRIIKERKIIKRAH